MATELVDDGAPKVQVFALAVEGRLLVEMVDAADDDQKGARARQQHVDPVRRHEVADIRLGSVRVSLDGPDQRDDNDVGLASLEAVGRVNARVDPIREVSEAELHDLLVIRGQQCELLVAARGRRLHLGEQPLDHLGLPRILPGAEVVAVRHVLSVDPDGGVAAKCSRPLQRVAAVRGRIGGQPAVLWLLGWGSRLIAFPIERARDDPTDVLVHPELEIELVERLGQAHRTWADFASAARSLIEEAAEQPEDGAVGVAAPAVGLELLILAVRAEREEPLDGDVVERGQLVMIADQGPAEPPYEWLGQLGRPGTGRLLDDDPVVHTVCG